MWQCEYCAPKNKKQWQARMLQTVETLTKEDWGFYTLTAHENAGNWHTSLLNLQNGWPILRRKMAYKAKKAGVKKFMYARVYEQHEDKRAHWHMIANWVPDDYSDPDTNPGKGSQWISDTARSSGMGYMTWTKRAEVKNAGYIVSYCTKYMTKMSETMPKGTRRVQTSHGWKGKQIEGSSEYDWMTMQTFTIDDASHLWKQGMTVTDTDTEQTITLDDFENTDSYSFDIDHQYGL
jgi:hypothetical protein